MAVCLNESNVDEWLDSDVSWGHVVKNFALDDESPAYEGLECYGCAGYVSKVGEKEVRNVMSLKEYQDQQDKTGIKSFFAWHKPEPANQKIPDKIREADKDPQENPFVTNADVGGPAPGPKAGSIFEFFGKAPGQKQNRIFEFFGKPTKITNAHPPKRRPPSSPSKHKTSKRVKVNSSPKIQSKKPDAIESQKKETNLNPLD